MLFGKKPPREYVYNKHINPKLKKKELYEAEHTTKGPIFR